jgi:UDP-N-acetylmuramoyl-tripeptide--D-alanyl-D-alanine ligase
MKISEIIKATDAKLIGNLEQDFDVQISTDTRTIKSGDLYLPLKGASFDGEKFIEQALEKGAVGAFCTEEHIIENNKFLLLVPNTLTAYLQLANYRRNKLNLTVVAITGSSGKTTTKEIVASALSSKYKTFKTPLNYNNEVGLCQTIFATPDDAQVLVLEMGMRGLGEIELLSKYSEPDITVVSNVGTAHIGRLGSRENIAKAKCEIAEFIKKDGLFIAHYDEIIKNTVNYSGEQKYYSISDIAKQNPRYDQRQPAWS